jgi:hypothetical protein
MPAQPSIRNPELQLMVLLPAAVLSPAMLRPCFGSCSLWAGAGINELISLAQGGFRADLWPDLICKK